MPTAMKNSPSSRPLKGSMSASSSWRNSDSASSTPAMKAPSEADSPARSASAIVSDDGQKRRRGEHLADARQRDQAQRLVEQQRPPTMTAAIDADALQAGEQIQLRRRCARCDGEQGRAARAAGSPPGPGTAACRRRRRPCRVLSCPFSASTCSTNAVEDSDSAEADERARPAMASPSASAAGRAAACVSAHLRAAQAEHRRAHGPQARRAAAPAR